MIKGGKKSYIIIIIIIIFIIIRIDNCFSFSKTLLYLHYGNT